MSKKHEDHLISESKKITQALGKMFAPFCEVVLHDLRNPDNSIVLIENNFSGRKVGEATTNVGLQRAINPEFPEVLQNYHNILPDGRNLKSTSIGIKNEEGKYIASICLNFDISFFTQLSSQLHTFTSFEIALSSPKENLKALSLQEIQEAVQAFASMRQVTPSTLSKEDKQELVQQLETRGLLQLRNAVSNLANLLGVTRPTIYSYLKAKD